MKEVLHVNGSTKRERHGVINSLHDGLLACGVSFQDYHQFGNTAIAMWFEVDAGKLPDVLQQFQEAGVSLTRTSEEDIERFAASDPSATVSGTLQITFFGDEVEPRVHLPGPRHVHGY